MDTYLVELERLLQGAQGKLKEELRGIRSNRPSIEFLESLKAEHYGSILPLNQLGSFSMAPPREVRVSVWDKGAVPAVMKAIEEARAGFSVSSDGNTVRATLSALSNERREELSKMVRKTVEGIRIEMRGMRDEVMKKMRAAEERGEITEDQAFTAKEKLEKKVKETNEAVERLLEEKLKELSE